MIHMACGSMSALYLCMSTESETKILGEYLGPQMEDAHTPTVSPHTCGGIHAEGVGASSQATACPSFQGSPMFGSIIRQSSTSLES